MDLKMYGPAVDRSDCGGSALAERLQLAADAEDSNKCKEKGQSE